jgi:Cu2+-exporting ATPase
MSLLVATPVVFYAGAPFFAGAWRGLARHRPGLDLPVALAIAAAYAASAWNTFAGSGEVYFDSAVMFVFFLTCARFLEMSGRHRALGLSGALARHLPRVALRVAHGRAEAVAVGELERGDVIVVQPGHTVPVDGTLASGSVRVDESLLTGESQPVRKAAGETVLAGSINLLGAATLRVTETGAGTVLASIGRLIAVARTERPRLVEITDRVGAWFVVGLLVLAVATGAVWWLLAPARAFEVVLAVLVVTCPCALALATPAAFTVAMSALARRGVLLRRAGALETLSRATDLVLDKTGTLTEHRAGVARIVPLAAIAAGDALALAAALESRSEHPLARAFPPPIGAASRARPCASARARSRSGWTTLTPRRRTSRPTRRRYGSPAARVSSRASTSPSSCARRRRARSPRCAARASGSRSRAATGPGPCRPSHGASASRTGRPRLRRPASSGSCGACRPRGASSAWSATASTMRPCSRAPTCRSRSAAAARSPGTRRTAC